MIDKSKFQNLKGKRIYQFWLDEETGEITDVTSRDDVIKVVYCKDCKHWQYESCFVESEEGDADSIILDRFAFDFCSRAERRNDETD